MNDPETPSPPPPYTRHPTPYTLTTAEAVEWEVTPDAWQEPTAAAFRGFQGRRVRWTLGAGPEGRTFVGRVPRAARWSAPDSPHLVLAPGTTDGVHVLAEIHAGLRSVNGELFLARRKWYEDQDLDLIRLGPGPVRLRLEPLSSGQAS